MKVFSSKIKYFIVPVVLLFLVFVFTKLSYANSLLRESVTISSQNRNFYEYENNSWELYKTARWLNQEEAEIEINVHSIPFDSTISNIVFLVEATEEKNVSYLSSFVASTLPELGSDTKISIVAYAGIDSAPILLSSSDIDDINDAIYELNQYYDEDEEVEYYNLLLNMEYSIPMILENNTDPLKVIFIGHPHEGIFIDNQEEEARLIKELYPGVEYYYVNTGDIKQTGFLNKIADYVGNSIELLLSAGVINDFVVTDYIDTDYFEYEEITESSYKFLAYRTCFWSDDGVNPYPSSTGPEVTDDSSSTCGPYRPPLQKSTNIKSNANFLIGNNNLNILNFADTSSLRCVCINDYYDVPTNTATYDNTNGKIIWNLSNTLYSTNAFLKFKVRLKNEFHDSTNIFTTNDSTRVESDLDGIEEDVSTTNSPELKLFYNVSYDGNMPSGCTWTNVTESHKILSSVTPISNSPTCSGYTFSHWYTEDLGNLNDCAYQSDYNEYTGEVTTHCYNEVLDDNFTMPIQDVHFKAIWTKVGAQKYFSGDEYGNYAIYSITQKSLNGATQTSAPTHTRMSTITNVQLNTLAATAEYTVTAVNLSDVDYRIEVEDVSNNNSNIDYEIVEGKVTVDANSSTTFTIRIKYKDGVSTLPENKTDTLTITYRFRRDGAMFKSGREVNEKMKKLVNSANTYYTDERTIKNITRFTGTPNSSYLVNSNNVATVSGDFPDPIYIWYDSTNKIIYWYTEATNVYYNYDASYFYSNFNNLNAISGISEISSKHTTNMNSMFYFTGSINNSFTLNLGPKFDTSNVTDMSNMFYYTGNNSTSFTLNLGSNFDTSNVTNMTYMFAFTGNSSTRFTLDLGSKFDTSNVTNMNTMFEYAGKSSTVFTLDLGDKFDTSSVTDMRNMFYYTGYSSTVFTLDLGDKFNTSNVTNMKSMFASMGYESLDLTLDLGDKFDTSNVTNMEAMFSNTGYKNTYFTLYLGDKFDTSNAINMKDMFNNIGRTSTVFTLNLGDKFDTSNVTDMESMFAYVGYSVPNFEIDLGDKFDTSRVTKMKNMFSNIGYNSTTFTLDLGDKFDTSNVATMSFMFYRCRYLTTIYAPTSFITTNVNISSNMFDGCTNLVGGAGTIYLDSNPKDKTYGHIDGGVSNPGYFTARTSAMFKTGKEVNARIKQFVDSNATYTSQDFTINRITRFMGTPNSSDLIDANKVSTNDSEYPIYMWYDDTESTDTIIYWYTEANQIYYNYDASYMFDELMQVNYITNLEDISSIYTTNMEYMFNMLGLYSSVLTLDLGDKFDTSRVTNMEYMFSSCGYYSSDYTLNLGNKFDTSNVTNMKGLFMFNGYQNTSFTLDLGNKFDTSKVTDMSSMFKTTGYKATLFTLDFGDKFDTSNVTNMQSMFEWTGGESSSFTIILGDKFDTSNVTNMNSMFYGTGYNVTNFMLSLGDKFDTSNVTDMGNMFNRCGYSSTVFTLDLGSKFDTSNVIDMTQLFANIGYSNTTFTLDLGSKFDTSNVTNMYYMFGSVGFSNPNFVLDLGSKFDTSNVTNMNSMFSSFKGKTIYVPTSFVTTNVTNSTGMFNGCTNLVGGAGTVYNTSNPKDKTYAHIDGGPSNPGYFTARP